MQLLRHRCQFSRKVPSLQFTPMSSSLTQVDLHQVLSKDGEHKVGKISKQWTGLLREMYTDADVFGINFPLDLDVKMKAVLLSTCFLIVGYISFQKIDMIATSQLVFLSLTSRILCTLKTNRTAITTNR